MKKNIHHLLVGLLLALAALAAKPARAQTCTVNLLVAYSNDAASGLQGNQAAIAKITAAVQGMQTAYNNSAVNHKVALVRTVQLTGFETSCFVNDLNSFQGSTYINTLRDKYHADVAVLVMANQEFCGLPYIDEALATTTTAYCAVNYTCMVSSFALSHQVAHLYGCTHYIEEASALDDAPYAYGHGFAWDNAEDYDAATSYSTIGAQEDDDMGGAETDNGIIIPYFSNPNITYNGVALGLAGVHNSAQVLNDNAAAVAAFKTLPNIQHTLVDTVDQYNMAIATARDTLGTGQYYSIKDNAQVQFKAGHRIVLQPGFTITEGAKFETFIESTVSTCSGQATRMVAGGNYPGKPVLPDAVKAPAEESAAGTEAVMVYPNPGNGLFTLSFKGLQPQVLEVYSQGGIQLQRIVLRNNPNTYKLDLRGLAQGVYLLNIIGKDKRVSKKLMIN